MYFKNYRYKAECTVIENGNSSKSFFVLYERKENDLFGYVEIYRIPASKTNLLFLIDRCKILDVDILFSNSFLRWKEIILKEMEKAKF